MTTIQSPKNFKNQLISFHFKNRVQERCGVWIGSKQIHKIIEMIQSNKLVKIDKKSLARGRFIVPRSLIDTNYQGEETIVVVYDTRRKMLVTAMDNYLIAEIGSINRGFTKLSDRILGVNCPFCHNNNHIWLEPDSTIKLNVRCSHLKNVTKANKGQYIGHFYSTKQKWEGLIK